MTKVLWLWPLVLLLFFAPYSQEVDLTLSSSYYHPETHLFSNNAFFQFIYNYGQYPAYFLAFMGMVLFLASLKIASLERFRLAYLLLALSMLIGPGIVTNGIMKPLWGRPRPRQVIELGGTASFLPFWKPNLSVWKGDVYKSLPSGHAASGFFFLTLSVIGIRYQKRLLIFLGLALAALFGGLLGWTRIAQGGHFLSDVLVALALTWWIALALDALLLRINRLLIKEG